MLSPLPALHVKLEAPCRRAHSSREHPASSSYAAKGRRALLCKRGHSTARRHAAGLLLRPSGSDEQRQTAPQGWHAATTGAAARAHGMLFFALPVLLVRVEPLRLPMAGPVVLPGLRAERGRRRRQWAAAGARHREASCRRPTGGLDRPSHLGRDQLRLDSACRAVLPRDGLVAVLAGGRARRRQG